MSLEDVPDTDHFSVVDQMVDPEFCLTKVRVLGKPFVPRIKRVIKGASDVTF